MDDRLKPEWVVERQGRQAVLYQGLLHLAHLDGLKEISVTLVQVPSELNGMVAIAHATVVTEKGTFSEIGDAAPTNVTRMIAQHIIRMAATRAKARALRDAVDIGMVAAEELGGDAGSDEAPAAPARPAAPRQARGPAWPEGAPTGNVVDHRPSGAAPDLAKLREVYRIRSGEAIALGVEAPALPVDADANTIMDFGIQLKDRLDEKRREIDAQRRGAGQ